MDCFHKLRRTLLAYQTCFVLQHAPSLDLCLLFQRVHDVRSQGQFCPADNVVARVKEVAVLEEQHATTFGYNVETIVCIPRKERGGTAFEELLTVLAYSITEVQVQRKIRSLSTVRCLVTTIAVRCQ